MGEGEIAQLLGTRAALPCAHMAVSHNHLQLQFREIHHPTPGTLMVCRHTCRQNTPLHKVKMNKTLKRKKKEIKILRLVKM